MHVVLAQNYSLHEIEVACAEGRRPQHHLWGADALRRAGHTVVTLGSRERGLLRTVSELSRFQVGDPDRQAVLRRTARLNHADVIVCGETRFVRGLALLRRAGVVRTPLVGVLHPHEPRRQPDRWAAGGFDRLLSLSREAARRTPVPSVVTTWGPDLGFPGYQPRASDRIVATGRTHRDLTLLGGAAADAGVALTVHDGPVPYAELLADLCPARAVAIPLSRTDGCSAITELNDALALGKFVLMTRTPYIDVDIEAVGCGRWIDPGDAAGLRRELARVAADPAGAAAMGASGREYAAERWNYQRFAYDLTAAVADLAS